LKIHQELGDYLGLKNSIVCLGKHDSIFDRLPSRDAYWLGGSIGLGSWVYNTSTLINPHENHPGVDWKMGHDFFKCCLADKKHR